MSLYKKIVDEAIDCTPMEKELARQMDKLQTQIDTQQNIIQTLSGYITKQVRV